MKTRAFQLAIASVLAALGNAWAQDKPAENPTWQDMISQGIVPYGQLTVDDIPINDTVHPKEGSMSGRRSSRGIGS